MKLALRDGLLMKTRKVGAIDQRHCLTGVFLCLFLDFGSAGIKAAKAVNISSFL
jgi:hypothetical protein